MKKIVSIILCGGMFLGSGLAHAQGVYPVFSADSFVPMVKQTVTEVQTKIVTDATEAISVDQLISMGEKGYIDSQESATSASDAVMVDAFPKAISEKANLTAETYKEPTKAVATIKENVMLASADAEKEMTTEEIRQAHEVVTGLKSDVAKAGIAAGLAQMEISKEQPKRTEVLQANLEKSATLREDIQSRGSARAAAAAEESRLLSIEAQLLGVEAAGLLPMVRSQERKKDALTGQDSSKLGV